jgi:nicotinamide mononucleotide transporter
VNVALYAILFFSERLYADAALQVIYVLLLGYGWSLWNQQSKGAELQVERTSGSTWLTLVFITIACSGGIGSLFKHYTNASLPYLDSTLTVVSSDSAMDGRQKKN